MNPRYVFWFFLIGCRPGGVEDKSRDTESRIDSVDTGGDSGSGGGASVTLKGLERPLIEGGRFPTETGETADTGVEGPNRWVKVSMGMGNACALDARGAVTCWGSDRGTLFKEVAGEWSDLSIFGDYGCLLDLDGYPHCVGEPERGDLGQMSPPDEPLLSVSSSWFQSCGLRMDRTIACWGWEWEMQAERIDGEYLEVSAGHYLTCGLTAENEVRCWGINERLYNPALPEGHTWVQVAAGGTHACALDDEGRIFCWSDDTWDVPPPPRGHTFRLIASGCCASCGEDVEGGTTCWADPYDGYGYVETTAPTDQSFASLSLRGTAACGLDEEGVMTCWGAMPYGLDEWQATPPD